MYLLPDLVSHLNEQVNKMLNKKNIVGIVTVLFIVLFSVVPTFAAQSSTQPVTVTVQQTIAISASWAGGANNSAINLGTLSADNMQNTFTGGATGEQLTTASNDAIDIWTKVASASFAGADPIAISNFMYSGLSQSTAKAFTTNYAIIGNNTPKAPQGNPTTYPVNLYLTIPYGTGAGTYTNTVYFSAVAHNAAAPTTP